jgi:hypothetical protein
MKERGYSLAEEGKNLNSLQNGIANRAMSGSLTKYCQLTVLLVLTSAVGLGYIYRAVRSSFLS